MRLYVVVCLTAMLASSVWSRAAPSAESSSTSEEFLPPGTTLNLNTTNFFTEKRVVFSSGNEITNLIVMYKGELVDETLGSEVEEMDLFFNQIQVQPDGSRVNLGQFVLVNNTAKKIFNGKCATTELGTSNVYFGAADGLYTYDKNKQEAVRLGDVTDDIVQIQVTNGTGLIYYLAADHRVYTVDVQGKNKQRFFAASYVKDFVLDRMNNFYYHGEDMIPYVLNVGSSKPVRFTALESVTNSKLVRPATFMDDGALFVTNREVYQLNADGTETRTPFVLDVKPQPTSMSVDIAVIQYYAIDGKIYEFNFIVILLEAVFGDEGFLSELVRKAKAYI